MQIFESTNFFHFADDSSNNGLLLTSDKTVALKFSKSVGKTNDSANIYLNNHELTFEHHFKFLVVTIDENLDFEDHINFIVKKLKSTLYVLKKSYSVESILLYYFAHVQSHLAYGIVIKRELSGKYLS